MSEKFFDSNNLDAWEKAAAKQAPGGDIGNLVWNTPEGLAVKALYTKKDVEGVITSYSIHYTKLYDAASRVVLSATRSEERSARSHRRPREAPGAR